MAKDQTPQTIQSNNSENPIIIDLPTAKQDHFWRLRQEGLNIKEASKIAGLKGTYGYEVDKKLKEKYLTHPGTRKLASSALQNILKGKTFGDVKVIKDSTVMQAAKEVYDRVDPKKVIQATETETKITVKIDLSQYQDTEKPVDGRSPHDVTLDMPSQEQSTESKES